VVPFVAFLVAVPLLWNRLVGMSDLALLAAMYLVCGLGVTVGFHRLLTQRSFATYRPVQYLLAVLGSMAVQGPVIGWVADHRKHHAHADEEGDPHSPHVGRGPGVRGMLKGLWHAHVGWRFTDQGRAEPRRYAPDLMDDPGMRLIGRAFVPLVVAGLALPSVAGWVLTGSRRRGDGVPLGRPGTRLLPAPRDLEHQLRVPLLWPPPLRDRRPVDQRGLARLPLAGGGLARNHHAFPRSARPGLRWWEVDPSGLLIRALHRLGLAWNVVSITPERQRAKALARL